MSEEKVFGLSENESGENLVDVNDVSEHPGAAWYVVHTYSGYENKVANNLQKRIVSMGMENEIFQTLVPTEEEVDFSSGKRRAVVRKSFPGYVFIEMIMTDKSWFVVRNTPGVTGFVSPGLDGSKTSGKPGKPDPMALEDVLVLRRQMGIATPTKVNIDLEVGQNVRVLRGPLTGNSGQIIEVDPLHEKIKILVRMFGRETPADVDFSQVEKLS